MPTIKIEVVAALPQLKKANPALYKAYQKTAMIDYYEPDWNSDNLLETIVDAIEHHGEKAVRKALKTKLKSDAMDDARAPMAKELLDRYNKVMADPTIVAMLLKAETEKAETKTE